MKSLYNDLRKNSYIILNNADRKSKKYGPIMSVRESGLWDKDMSRGLFLQKTNWISCD